MHRVFLSSTFVDLIEYRKAAQVTIRQLGAIDVSMEHFGARDDRPSEECIRLVKKESDIFVGIYAHRYGHVPDGSMISICEMEYIAASGAKLPRFVYVVDDGQPWLPAYIDVGPDAEQLRRFKDHLSKSHICQKFGNFDHLAARVAADLGRHIAMVDREKVGRDIPVRDIGVNSLRPIDLEAFGAGAPSKGEYSPQEWNKLRNGIYKHNRNVFLARYL